MPSNFLHSDSRERRQRGVWLIAITVRLLSAFSIATFFQPDEYYQSLEPAWQLVFGRSSGAWLTWEWDNQLRSSLHPVLVAAVYYLTVVVGWVFNLPLPLRTQMLLFAPKIFHAVFAAAMDYSTWRLTEIVFGVAIIEADAALALSLFNPWQWFVGTRSLTNGLEASLTAMAMVHFPWSWILESQSSSKRQEDIKRLKYCIMLAATAGILRPTNVLIWAVLTLGLFFFATLQEILDFSQQLAFYGTGVLVVSSGLDRLYYGSWTFPAGRFLYFNLSQDLAVFYGRNRLDYYLTEGLPILLTTSLPFAVAGIAQNLTSLLSSSAPDSSKTTDEPTPSSRKKPQNQSSSSTNSTPVLRILAVSALAYPLTLSMISHKEVRFLHPVLPPFLVLAARPVTTFFHPFPKPASTSKRLILAMLVILTISFTAYISNVHQRGPLSVLAYLRDEFEVHNADILTDSTREHRTPLISQFGHASLLSLFAHLTRRPTQDTKQIAPNTINNPTHQRQLSPISAAFLTPCHSTPWRSHLLHPEIHAWVLTCNPPLDIPLSERDAYLDEADVFYADPASWLRENMDMSTLPLRGRRWLDRGWDREKLRRVEAEQGDGFKRPWPRYLVMFEQLEPLIWGFLGEEATGVVARAADGQVSASENGEDVDSVEVGYRVCWRGFNSHWHDDWRRKGAMVVLCAGGSGEERNEVVGGG